MPETKNKECLNWALLASAANCSLKRPSHSSYCDCSLAACLSDQSSVLSKMLQVPTLFHPKTQILIFQMSKFVPKVVYRYLYIKRHSKLHKTWNQNIISTQFNNPTKFHQNFQQQPNSHHQSIIMKIQYINSSTTHSITTTTTINHKIIHNLTTTSSFYINYVKTQSIPMYTLQACKFNINNTIIIQFTYLNMSSKLKHKFLQLSSK